MMRTTCNIYDLWIIINGKPSSNKFCINKYGIPLYHDQQQQKRKKRKKKKEIYKTMTKMESIRSAGMKEFKVGEPLDRGEGASEICDPLPLRAVTSSPIETVGATAGESGSIGRVFDSSVP